MPTLALLANPQSGTGRAERVADLLSASGADVQTYPVSEWRAAAESGADRIVVAGGDGSLGCAADAARTAEVPLAVVATGTANDFVRRLDLPTELEAACELAATGRETRRLELARAGERPFLNIASVGLSPAAAAEAHGLKRRLGALAYPIGALRAGFTAHPVPCSVVCDGEEIYAGEAWQISVSSSGGFGGGAAMRADETDGRLDVVVIEGSGRARLVKFAYGMRIGSLEDHRGVDHVVCDEAALRLDDPRERLNVDGEIFPSEELETEGTIRFGAQAAAFELVVG